MEDEFTLTLRRTASAASLSSLSSFPSASLQKKKKTNEINTKKIHCKCQKNKKKKRYFLGCAGFCFFRRGGPLGANFTCKIRVKNE